MKTLVTAIIMVALFSIAFHELSKRDNREKQAIASPEISNSLPTKLPVTENAVIKKIGRASKITAQRVSTEARDPKPVIQETLQVYLPEEKRAVSISVVELDNGGGVRIDTSAERLEELFHSAITGAGHEAPETGSGNSGNEPPGIDSGHPGDHRDSDGLDRNRDKDREDHAYRENGDDHEHFDRSERHHKE